MAHEDIETVTQLEYIVVSWLRGTKEPMKLLHLYELLYKGI